MPVSLEIVWEAGWKSNKGLKDPIMCYVFTDIRTKKVLFKYAPKYDDIPTLLDGVGQLITYEGQKIKKIKAKLKAPCNKEVKIQRTKGIFPVPEDSCNEEESDCATL